MDECPGQVRVQEEPDYFFSGACLYAHMSTRKTLTSSHVLLLVVAFVASLLSWSSS